MAFKVWGEIGGVVAWMTGLWIATALGMPRNDNRGERLAMKSKKRFCNDGERWRNDGESGRKRRKERVVEGWL